jgi:hypothetical protein
LTTKRGEEGTKAEEEVEEDEEAEEDHEEAVAEGDQEVDLADDDMISEGLMNPRGFTPSHLEQRRSRKGDPWQTQGSSVRRLLSLLSRKELGDDAEGMLLLEEDAELEAAEVKEGTAK